MIEQRKKAATFLTLLLMTAGAIFLARVSIATLQGRILGNEGVGQAFMLAIANWDQLGAMLKGLALVVTVGLALLGAYRLKDWMFYSIIAVCVIGVASAIFLLLEVSAVGPSKQFWQYSPVQELESYESFKAAAQRSLGWIGAWFISIIVSELGIKQWAPFGRSP